MAHVQAQLVRKKGYLCVLDWSWLDTAAHQDELCFAVVRFSDTRKEQQAVRAKPGYVQTTQPKVSICWVRYATALDPVFVPRGVCTPHTGTRASTSTPACGGGTAPSHIALMMMVNAHM
jgi:hypothetical protein